MKKIVRLTESQLVTLVRTMIREEEEKKEKGGHNMAKIEKFVDDMLADDMAKAFDMAGMSMPEKLSGTAYENKMDKARAALIKLIKKNPKLMNESKNKRKKSIRENFDSGRQEMTVEQFYEALEHGPFSFPGGYPLYFVLSDGDALCFDSAEENKETIADAIREKDNSSGWRVVAIETNWEDDNLYCSHFNEKIPSAYGEDDDE